MTTIKLKNGSGAPTAGDLVQGEPALDLTNKRLYTEDSGGTVIEVGTNPTSITTGDITATGTATFANLATSGDVTFGDNDKAIFGAGSDLQIYHDGSSSYITDSGTGNLRISGTLLQLNDASFNKYLLGSGDSVRLYHADSEKLQTTSTGIDVTGDIAVNDATPSLNLYDSDNSTRTVLFNNSGISYLNAYGITSGTYGSFILNSHDHTTSKEILRADNTNIQFKTDGTLRGRFLSNGDYVLYNDAATSTDFYWDASASSLGLGTTSPSTTYSVDATKPMRITASAPSVELVETDATNQRWSMFGLGGNLTFRDITNNVYAMTLEASTGNVGIGNTPVAGRGLFQIHDGNTDRDMDGNANGQLHIDGNGYAFGIALNAEGANIYTNSVNRDIIFGTNETERVRIDGSGNVGIGESSPAYELDVNSTIHIGNDGGSSFTHSRLILDANGASRAAGIFSHNQVNDTEWFFGNPYDTPDSFAINRLATASHSDATANKTNSLVTINSSGNVELPIGNDQTIGQVFSTAHSSGNVGSIGLTISDGGGHSGVFVNNTHDGTYSDQSITFKTAEGGVSSATERMRINSSGNVGIGTDSPTANLEISAATSRKLDVVDTTGARVRLSTASGQTYVGSTTAHPLNIITNDAIRATIDSSGNLLVGKSGSALGTAGVEINQNGVDGKVWITRSGGEPLVLNRETNDGTLLELYQGSGTQVGNIRSRGGAVSTIIFDPRSNGSGLTGSTNGLLPTNEGGGISDDGVDLGSSTARFRDIYAGNSTIQTSDRNQKQDIEELSDAEQRVAVACKGLLRKFRWKSAVEKKGDDARIHFGIIAQDLQDAFTSEGLDAGRYGMFINSTWTDEETGEEQSRMGVRYSELLAFIISAI